MPEVAGKRFTPQNDGEKLLYMLVGQKISNFEANITVLIDLWNYFKKSENFDRKKDLFGFLNHPMIK